mmetsp:Transcript_91186/g.175564  ORF Transcript_91186/g.175564 Transcript_91186/m.175564 type:complete len:425 (-) Transcript_91186:177-1451(-)
MAIPRRSRRRRACGAVIDAAAVATLVVLCWSSSSSHVLARHLSNLSAFASAGFCRDDRRAVIREATTVEDLIQSRLVPTTKENRYQYMVEPKLRSMVQTSEYKRVVEILGELKNAGELESFLRRLDEYWAGLELFSILSQANEGGPDLKSIVRRDWVSLWPSSWNSSSQKESFQTFSGLWKRLDQSRLFDDSMRDVLPEFKRRSTIALAAMDRDRLSKMSDEDREEEFVRRMENVEIIQQYLKLIKDDEDVQYVAKDVFPSLIKFVSSYEKKAARTAVVEIGTIPTALFFVLSAVALANLLQFWGVIKLPSFEDQSMPAYSVRTIKEPEPEVTLTKKFDFSGNFNIFNLLGEPQAPTKVPDTTTPTEGEAAIQEAPSAATQAPGPTDKENTEAVLQAPPTTKSELSSAIGKIRIAGGPRALEKL